MTKSQKERKIKLLSLIIIVESEYVRRNVFKNTLEAFQASIQLCLWTSELFRVSQSPVFTKKIAIVGDNSLKEIIASPLTK